VFIYEFNNDYIRIREDPFDADLEH